MNKVIYEKDKHKIPAKLWLEDIEDSALKQVNNLQSLPFAFHHIAIMPDCHMGYGMPIGGVLATHQVVIPNAVGVDIGCGMCAIKTNLKIDNINKKYLKTVMGKIRQIIPVGFNHHKTEQQCDLERIGDFKNSEFIVDREYRSALKQIGTLGGGNHFIEIQKDKEGFIWIMIHSGSRNLGYKVAGYYNEIAKELNTKYYSNVSKEWDLAFLPLDTEYAQNYIIEMNYCVDFAFKNRQLMMNRILDIFKEVFNLNEDIEWYENLINIAHNYARMENHFGHNVMVHRKGATSAKLGEIGIIPGSQGSKSYIVEGLGNKESFNSCSHGAGRKMGRKQATKTLNLEEEIKKLDDKGIIHGLRNIKNLDEATGAYKDIDEVMNNQKDLVKILVELQPLAVIKGD